MLTLFIKRWNKEEENNYVFVIIIFFSFQYVLDQLPAIHYGKFVVVGNLQAFKKSVLEKLIKYISFNEFKWNGLIVLIWKEN